jgi:hypothetical protein
MVFVYYLDECNTALWKLFFVSSLLASLMVAGYFGLKLLSVRGDRRALERAGITGSTYEKLKPDIGRRLRNVLISGVFVFGLLTFYVSYFSDFDCTPDSVFWVGER